MIERNNCARACEGHGHFENTLTGVPGGEDNLWKTLSAIGDLAFAFSFSTNLINIQVSLAPFIYSKHLHTEQINWK